MLTFRSRHHRFKALLAIWMTVVSVGVSLTHCHNPECPGHLNNVCWHSDCGGHLLNGVPVDPCQQHRHLVILGWELTGEADTNQQNPDSQTTKLTAAVDGACVTMPVSIPVADAAFVEFVTFEPCNSPVFADIQNESIPLSPFARHLVSGVLRS